MRLCQKMTDGARTKKEENNMMSKHSTLDLATNLDLEAERKFASQSNKTARVKIERGHAWLIRFLPFPQGPAREPFARLAQHWIGGRTVMCKTNTSPNFGGDPSYVCPICETAAECKNEARDDDERDDFYAVEARISYRSYCLVFRKEDNKGRVEEMTGDEIYIPHEFNVAKSSFATLSAKIERSKSRAGAPPMGLLDLEKGSDLWAIRDAKNSLTFDLSEDGPAPIFTLDEFFEEKLARVWKQLKQPMVKYLADDRMESIADMIAEKAFEKAAKSLSERQDDGGGRGRGSSPRGGGSRGRFHEGDDYGREETPRGRGRAEEPEGDQGQEEAPRGRSSRAAAPARSSFARAQAALGDDGGPGGDDDQIPGAEVPARGRGRATQAEEAPPEAQDGGEPAEEAPPVSNRRGGSAARPAATGRVSVPPGVAAGRRAGAAPPPPPPARQGGGRVEDEGPGEGEPPEEANDPAPAEPAETAPVERAPSRQPAGRGGVAGALRQSVQNLASRGR